MTDTAEFDLGGYGYIPGPFQYSAGVIARPGFEIERARFRQPVPMAEGFDRIAAHLAEQDRPPGAFCACEMRSPGQFSDDGFRRFNEGYVETLKQWGIISDGRNPVARSNVCPELDPPGDPSFFAFSYTVPRNTGAHASFVVAGSGEAREGGQSYAESIVRLGDTSQQAMGEKVCFVLDEMERRMDLLGVGWPECTATQVYTVFDIHPFVASEMVRRGAARNGLTDHFARPPVVGLDFEMDVRGLAVERILD